MDNHYTVPSKYRLLESTLEEIISFINPVEEDKRNRQNVIDELHFVLQSVESLKGAIATPFGSFVSNIYTKWADLDISIELHNKASGSVVKDKKKRLLHDIMNALQRTGHGRGFEYIPNARVPLLKFHSRNQNISCDISIDNHLGILKSKFLLWITQIDGRLGPLILLVKEWAKACKINDAKLGTLNSYSLCLLVIFHLQTCQPAILPPLKEIFGFTSLCDVAGRGFIDERCMEETCTAKMVSFKSSNKHTLSELLISFFKKFSEIQRLSSQYAICTYTGKWESKWSKLRWIGKSYNLIIEDPFEQPENAARAVGLKELGDISSAFLVAKTNFESAKVLSQKILLSSSLVRPFIVENLKIRRRAQVQRNSTSTVRNDVHSPNNAQLKPKVGNASFRSQINGNAKMLTQPTWVPKNQHR